MLREAVRQKQLAPGPVPRVCILDPDGDIVRRLQRDNAANLNPHWACYHTRLYDFMHDGIQFGIIGCAVGASFAVLVAEQLFASGCELLISVTSSGQITPNSKPPYFILIDKALRDEGTSYHYLPAADYAFLNADLLQQMQTVLCQQHPAVYQGSTWTTDAPFRETAQAVAQAAAREIWAVEMEAAALYAFASARNTAVVCFAHVTNQMGRVTGDFEKGDNDGSTHALQVISSAARAYSATGQ